MQRALAAQRKRKAGGKAALTFTKLICTATAFSTSKTAPSLDFNFSLQVCAGSAMVEQEQEQSTGTRAAWGVDGELGRWWVGRHNLKARRHVYHVHLIFRHSYCKACFFFGHGDPPSQGQGEAGSHNARCPGGT